MDVTYINIFYLFNLFGQVIKYAEISAITLFFSSTRVTDKHRHSNE